MPLVACTSPPPDTKSSAAPAEESAPLEHALTWTPVADGIEVLRLWEHIEPTPTTEMAVLRLNDTRHKEFLANPLEFVNTHGIFPAPVRVLNQCATAERDDGPEDTTDLWWLIWLPHWPDSFGRCAAYLDWPLTAD